MPFGLEAADFVTIGLLVILEGLLSADNALVLALLVLSLPREQQRRALRYGMAGAFGFRVLAIMLAAYLMEMAWVKLAGGLYLGYLAWGHFASRGHDERGQKTVRPARPAFGLSAFWVTVVKVEMVDLAFSIDSILVAVALSPKLAVVITGGILGIVAMRLVAGQMIELIRKYPALVDGAFVIIGWIALKLVLDYAHHVGLVGFEVPKTISLGLIVVIFVISYIYARRQWLREQKTAPSPEGPADLPQH